MTLARFRAPNHPQQIAKPKVDDRATTPEVFDPLHARFAFTLDAAASPHNAKCPRYFSIDREGGGLEASWAGERIWCNPPYSSIEPWIVKANAEAQAAELIVMLLPANRTEQGWWQRRVEPFRDGRSADGPRTEFIAGRLRFIAPDSDWIKPNERPPFGCVLLLWGAARNIPSLPAGQGTLDLAAGA